MTIDKYHIERFTIPFEQVRENLRKIFDEYGVTMESQAGFTGSMTQRKMECHRRLWYPIAKK